MSKPLKLFYSPDSANLVVRFVLEELELAYEDVLLDRSSREHMKPEYRALNPQGLIPVLVDAEQDAPMFETGAIILHLADRAGRLAPAPNSPSRGSLLKWLFYISNTLHADLRVAFYVHRYVEGEKDADTLRKSVLRRVQSHFALLDAELAKGGGKYLIAETFTVADFYLAACARWAQLYPTGYEQDLSQHRHLVAFLKALQERASVRHSAERESIKGNVLLHPKMPETDLAAVLG
ncbi:glutathione S-transferase family protein [Stappia sediminis]|nr:glutathione S-transferase family protein [Stappia sediminis]